MSCRARGTLRLFSALLGISLGLLLHAPPAGGRRPAPGRPPGVAALARGTR